jgi:hypothetical protein
MTCTHPSVGQFLINGNGVGSVNIQMTGDRTGNDVAADGSVMVSKLAGNNGVISFSMQQTSPFHKWLMKYWNYIKDVHTPSSEYALMRVHLRSLAMEEEVYAYGVAPQKAADKPYQAQGQQVTWNLMAADIDQN